MREGQPDIPTGRGCGKPAAVLGFIAAVAVFAIVVVGIIAITHLASYSDTTAVVR